MRDRASVERFTAMYNLCYPSVLRFLQRRTSCAAAEDVAAEVFTIAWSKFDAVPCGGELPWLYRVARLTLANEHRRRARRDGRPGLWDVDRPEGLSADFAPASAGALDVERAMRELPEADQEALRLVIWDDLDLKTAARVLGCSAATLAVRLHRARRRLRARLERLDDNPHPAGEWELREAAP